MIFSRADRDRLFQFLVGYRRTTTYCAVMLTILVMLNVARSMA